MNSWPITDEVPFVDHSGQCALCDEVFPFVNVLSCRRLKGGEVPICLTCHQRVHPACTIAQSVLASTHYECQFCSSPKPVLICALCSMTDSKDEILDGVLLCQSCSDQVHTPGKHHHRDHFYPIASPRVVAVCGPVQWHNYLDILCDHSLANQHQPHTFQPPASQLAAVQQVVAPPRPHVVTSQQAEVYPKGGASGTRSMSIVFGGPKGAGVPHVMRKRIGGSRSSFRRFNRTV